MRMTLYSSPARRACLLALVAAAGLGCAVPVLAQDLPFSGRWLLDEGQKGAYTALTVKGNTLSWSATDKSVPACTQAFAVKNEARGTEYANGRGTKFVSGVPGSLPTYLLTIGAGSCKGIEDTVRIIYPLVYDTRHIEIIEYVKGKPVTARRFHRKDAAK